MDRGLYLVCMCWLFGHKWEKVGLFEPKVLHRAELKKYPSGYYSQKCAYCKQIEEFPLVTEEF